MKFGVFYELQLPKPWGPDDEYHLLNNALDQVELAESGVGQIILSDQAGRNRHEHICEALELFAAHVRPEFHALEPDHQEWKRFVLAGEVEPAEIDTEPFKMLSLQAIKQNYVSGRRPTRGRCCPS